MSHWSTNTVFYHIYPLGLCGAPEHNRYPIQPEERLDGLAPWLEHAASLGCNGLYLGPVFESGSHGYDTVDYYNVDRRLGDRQTLRRLTDRAHQLGLKVILDGVFNHVGREFWAFKEVLVNRHNSAYRDWFAGLRFDRNNRFDDGLCYDTWDGHENLVKLNLKHLPVKEHLLGAVKHWVEEYDIDGLRLDAADVIDKDFLSELAVFSKNLKPDFWLMGEVVHGDYRDWASQGRLDSVTNYECFKGLYSSFNDHNLFEIAWSLNRQFGEEGLYRGINLYSFADNHDVNRVASLLKNPAHLFPLYALLLTMPGVPSIYYGSEFGIKGEKDASDMPLRPALNLAQLIRVPEILGLSEWIKWLIQVRKERPALQVGEYRQLYLTNEQFAYSRTFEGESIITLINAADHAAMIEFLMPESTERRFVNIVQPELTISLSDQTLKIEIPANSAIVLIPE